MAFGPRGFVAGVEAPPARRLVKREFVDTRAVSLSTFLLFVGVFVGVAAGGVGYWIGRRRDFGVSSVAVAALTIVVAAVTASGAGRAAGRLGSFGIMHVWYLLATISVPIAAVMLSWGRRRTGAPRRAIVSALLLVGMLPAPIGFYATHIEPFWLKVDRVSLEVHTGATAVRVGVVADLQTPRVGSTSGRQSCGCSQRVPTSWCCPATYGIRSRVR